MDIDNLIRQLEKVAADIRDHEHAEGWLFGPFCVVAGLERFVIEFFRAKDDRFVAGLTYAQLIATGFVVLGVIWMLAFRRVRDGWPGIHAPPAAPVATDAEPAAGA